MAKAKLGQAALREIMQNESKGVPEIRRLIEAGEVTRSQARSLFAWFAENGYDIEDGWKMLSSIPGKRKGVSGVKIGDKATRKLHTGKTGRRGLYLNLLPYGESDDVKISYGKKQVTITGIVPAEGDDADSAEA